MGVLAVRLSGLQGLHRELKWDGEAMKFTNISPNDKIKIVTVLMEIPGLIVVSLSLTLWIWRMSGLTILIRMGSLCRKCLNDLLYE